MRSPPSRRRAQVATNCQEYDEATREPSIFNLGHAFRKMREFDQAVHWYKEGESFGEISLITDTDRNATVIADVEPTEFMKIPRAVYLKAHALGTVSEGVRGVAGLSSDASTCSTVGKAVAA